MQEIEMMVESISATCSTKEAVIERKMRLVDVASLDSYSNEVIVNMPAIPGVGTGDVMNVTVELVWPATEFTDILEARNAAEEVRLNWQEDDDG